MSAPRRYVLSFYDDRPLAPKERRILQREDLPIEAHGLPIRGLALLGASACSPRSLFVDDKEIDVWSKDSVRLVDGHPRDKLPWITWISCQDPFSQIRRRGTSPGETRQIVITGLLQGFAFDAPRTFELPEGCAVHEVPRGTEGLDLARRIGGVLFVVPAVACPSEVP